MKDIIMNENKKLQKIKIIRDGSSYVDVNGILKGVWCGFKEKYDEDEEVTKDEKIHGIYYNLYSRYIPINEYGLFYGRFDCRKYDAVLELPYVNIYICEKNGRFGLVDSDGKYLLHTTYTSISPFYWGLYTGYGMHYLNLLGCNVSDIWDEKYRDSIFFVVTTETGKFLYKLSNRKMSDVYDDIKFSDIETQIIYKSEEKFGVLDMNGNVLLKPYFEFSEVSNHIFYEYQGLQFSVKVENGLLYRKIPASEYDICLIVGYDTRKYYGHYYIVKKGEKFGLLTDKYQLLSEPILDDVILYNPKNHILKGCLRIEDRYIEGSTQGVTFVIARLGKKYKLFNSRNCHTILDDCNLIKYTSFRKWDDSEPKDYIEFYKEDTYGCVLWNEKIISNQEYDEIKTDQFYIYVKKMVSKEFFCRVENNCFLAFMIKFVIMVPKILL